MEKSTNELKELKVNRNYEGGINDISNPLLNDFNQIVKVDDIENLPEGENKLCQTLKEMTQYTLQLY
jgi:hypothetical protein|tara:strand:- start:185 stop:385 length:201 start_codon:yes stop_codon:yes gene_type:complete